MGCQDSAETDRQWQERDDRVKYLERELIDLATVVAKGNASGISAIRAYRTATGATLDDSKRWYDALRTDPPPSARSELDTLKARVAALERWQAAFDTALDGRKP